MTSAGVAPVRRLQVIPPGARAKFPLTLVADTIKHINEKVRSPPPPPPPPPPGQRRQPPPNAAPTPCLRRHVSRAACSCATRCAQIDYCVNGSRVLHFPVTARVVPVTVELSSEDVQFEYGLDDWDSHLERMVQVRWHTAL